MFSALMSHGVEIRGSLSKARASYSIPKVMVMDYMIFSFSLFFVLFF